MTTAVVSWIRWHIRGTMGHNGSMDMSDELITIIIPGAILLVTLGGMIFAGFVWMNRRMEEGFARLNQKFDKLDLKFDQGFDRMDERFDRLDHKFDQMFDKMGERFDRLDHKFDKIDEKVSTVRAELNDAKAAIARLEGPRQRRIHHHWPRYLVSAMGCQIAMCRTQAQRTRKFAPSAPFTRSAGQSRQYHKTR